MNGWLTAAALIVALAGCRDRPEPPIVVEADTARMEAPIASPVVESEAPASAPEVVVIEERARATGGRPVAEPGRARLGEAAPVPDTRPPAAMEPAGPIELAAGTRLALELKTPLHSASTRAGDRFAARTTEPVEVGGRPALEAGALIEGRVAAVVSAGSGDEAGRIELDFRTIELPSGERVPLAAEIASVAGRPADPAPRPGPGQVITGAAVGAGVGGAVGGRKGAAIGAIVGAVGTTLVAGARDHEVVVPSGTAIEIVLTAPVEIPPQ